MGCAAGTIKYALFLLNTLWAILGILVIIFGCLGWDAMPQNYAIGIVILGGIMLVISFFGCFGAIRESARVLWTYVSLLLLLVVIIVAYMCVNTRYVFRQHTLQVVEDTWRKELTQPGAMDTIQDTYGCCGRNSSNDYVKIGRFPPTTCCWMSNCINPSNVYRFGCLAAVERSFADEPTTTQYIQWILLIFDLTILILAALLAIHITNRKRRYNY